MRFISYSVNLIFNLINDFEEKNIQEYLEIRISLIFGCLNKKKKQVLCEFVLKNKNSKYKFGEKKDCCVFICFLRVLCYLINKNLNSIIL
jgi:hypothetical protein